MFSQYGGRPGPAPQVQAVVREVFYQGRDKAQFVGKPITLDPNTSWADNQLPIFIPAGTIVAYCTGTTTGLHTAGNWENAYVGLSQAAYTSGGTSLTVTAGVATEIARLIASAGASLAMNIVGPPTANGTNAVISTTVSAASGTTLTITNLAANMVSGALICFNDITINASVAAGTKWSIICDPEGLKVADGTNINRVAAFDPQILLAGGVIDINMLINWPSDTSIQAWLIANIKAYVISVGFYSAL